MKPEPLAEFEKKTVHDVLIIGDTRITVEAIVIAWIKERLSKLPLHELEEVLDMDENQLQSLREDCDRQSSWEDCYGRDPYEIANKLGLRVKVVVEEVGASR